MTRTIMITALLWLMVQAVAFGVGSVVLLATPLSAHAAALMPWMVGFTIVISVPIAWAIAPRLKAPREIASPAPTV